MFDSAFRYESEDYALLDVAEINGIVARVRDATDGHTDLVSMLAWLGLRVRVVEDLPVAGLLARDVVLVRPIESIGELHAVLWHEVAHEVLRREGCEHSHGDVWALTALLGRPPAALPG